MSTSDTSISGPIVAAAAEVAAAVSARAVFVYAGALKDPTSLHAAIRPPTELILVARAPEEEQRAKSMGVTALSVPRFELTRMGQIKMAALIAFSQQLLKQDDVFVFLSGVVGREVDTLVTMRVGEEFELFQSVGQPKLTEHIRRPVFERILRIVLELAHEGREGKPVGAVFVLGDHREVLQHCMPGRINPFKGYAEKERNILDESITDSVKEIAKLDGAFIVKGNGVIIAACMTLRPPVTANDIPQGMGTRHTAAAGITASTKSVAVTLSESTGDVRIWRRGALITEIERAPASPLEKASGNQIRRG